MSSPNHENESDTNADINVSHMTFSMVFAQNTNMDSYVNLQIFECHIAAEPCTLQAYQELLMKSKARRSKLKHKMKKFRHKACGRKGRRKRFRAIMKKSTPSLSRSVTRKEGKHVKALGQKL